MRKGKSIALVSMGLVAGLVLGSVSFAAAAPADTQPSNAVVASGLKLGQSIRDAGGRLIDIVADLTGLSTDEVIAEREEGNSVADIAEANGVSSEDVVAEALSVRKEILDARVADGTLTQERADEILAQMSERLSDRVTSDEMGRPEGAGGGRGSGGRGAGGRGACDGSCAAAETTQ